MFEIVLSGGKARLRAGRSGPVCDVLEAVLAEVGKAMSVQRVAPSPGRGGSGRRGPRRRPGPRSARLCRRSPPRSLAASPCAGRRALDRARASALVIAEAAASARQLSERRRRRRLPECRPRRPPRQRTPHGRPVGARRAPRRKPRPRSPSSSLVEPSTSVKRKVTVPEGRSFARAVIIRRREVRV